MLLTGFTIAIEEETSDRETPPTSGVCGQSDEACTTFSATADHSREGYECASFYLQMS